MDGQGQTEQNNMEQQQQQGGGGGGGNMRRDFREKRPRQERGNMQERPRKDFVKERLASVSGPTVNLELKNKEPKKFTGRCRLFVGNLPNTMNEQEFEEMFKPFGETAEVFLNKAKGFGFVKLDTRPHAESAKAALDFSYKDGKYLRVRFATHGAALKVKNLNPWVSNELLETAFSIFGDVERAVVIVDDRGRPVGEGIVEYSRKQAAQLALSRCNEGCFILTRSLRPVLVEPLEQRDEEDGLQEKNLPKNVPDYLKEREVGPRLIEQGEYDFDYCNRWKQLYEVERQKRENLEKEIQDSRRRLDMQMEDSMYEHESNMLREKLRHIEEQTNYYQREREMRMQDQRRREEQRRQEEMMLRQQQDELLHRRGDMYGQDMMQQGPMQGMPPQGPGGYDMDAPPPGPPLDGGMPPQRPSRFDQPPPQHYMGGPPNPPPPPRGTEGPEDYGGMESKRRRF